jgi:Dynamin GTPase effector domain
VLLADTSTPVAYKRFADNVPLAIDRELVCGIKQDILSILYSKLGLNGPDGHKICKELAQESPQVADKRVDLQKKLERLQTASSQLLSVGTLGKA